MRMDGRAGLWSSAATVCVYVSHSVSDPGAPGGLAASCDTAATDRPKLADNTPRQDPDDEATNPPTQEPRYRGGWQAQARALGLGMGSGRCQTGWELAPRSACL